MFKRIIVSLSLFIGISACAQLGEMIAYESPYTRAIDALAQSSGVSTVYFAISQVKVQNSIGNTEQVAALTDLINEAIVDVSATTITFSIQGLKEVNKYLSANPADFESFLSTADAKTLLSVGLDLYIAQDYTQMAIDDADKLRGMTPEGKDSLYVQTATEVSSFAVSSQQAQLKTLSTLLPEFAEKLTGQGIDLAAAAKGMNASEGISDFLK